MKKSKSVAIITLLFIVLISCKESKKLEVENEESSPSKFRIEILDEEALKIIGGSLSKPSKMPGWSIGLPAKECKTGGKLQAVKGSVCYDCYALKGCYVFKVVQDAQYRRLAALKDPNWVTTST